MKQPAVYIMTNRRNGAVYTGVTSDLIKRLYEHKINAIDGFTKKYGCHLLVFYEIHENSVKSKKNDQVKVAKMRTL